MSKANWRKIKHEYLTTTISQKALAEKYGLAIMTVANRARDEHWFQARKDYRERTLDIALSKTAERQAAELATLMSSTDRLIQAIDRALQDEQQLHRHIVSIGCGAEVEERVYGKLDTRAVRDLTAAIKDLTSLQREYYNLPTPAQDEAQRIAAERLAMDKRKAESEDQTDRTIEVIIGGAAEGYAK